MLIRDQAPPVPSISEAWHSWKGVSKVKPPSIYALHWTNQYIIENTLRFTDLTWIFRRRIECDQCSQCSLIRGMWHRTFLNIYERIGHFSEQQAQRFYHGTMQRIYDNNNIILHIPIKSFSPALLVVNLMMNPWKPGKYKNFVKTLCLVCRV